MPATEFPDDAQTANIRGPSRTFCEILAAAARRFAVTGYKGTSLQDIARAVGCSKATVLYHFANKDEIVFELYTAYEARVLPLYADPEGRSLTVDDLWLWLHLCMHLYLWLYLCLCLYQYLYCSHPSAERASPSLRCHSPPRT